MAIPGPRTQQAQAACDIVKYDRMTLHQSKVRVSLFMAACLLNTHNRELPHLQKDNFNEHS